MHRERKPPELKPLQLKKPKPTGQSSQTSLPTGNIPMPRDAGTLPQAPGAQRCGCAPKHQENTSRQSGGRNSRVWGLEGCAGGYSQGGRRPQPTASAVPAAQPSSRCRCDAAEAGTRAVACSACAAGPTPLPRHLTAVLGCQQPMAPGPGAEVSAGSGLPRFLHRDAGPKNSSWWWCWGGGASGGAGC